jgi:hypothetical protein
MIKNIHIYNFLHEVGCEVMEKLLLYNFQFNSKFFHTTKNCKKIVSILINYNNVFGFQKNDYLS